MAEVSKAILRVNRLEKDVEWVKSDISEIKEDLKSLKINQVRIFEKIGDLHGELHNEIGSLRGDMHKEFSNVHEKFSELHSSITSMSRWLLVGILAAVTLISVINPVVNNWLAK